MSKEIVKYSWVETHKELVKFLADKQDNQKQLIDLLKKVGMTVFKDKDINGETELDEIDPFTFFFYIYKYGSQRRLKYLQKIAETVKILPLPSDESGIPSAQPQQVWLFPYKAERKNNEISRLWDLFFSALEDNISDEQFENILEIKGAGKTKLTEALFNINPEKYFPINGPTIPYLQKRLGIDPKFNTYTEYIELLKTIRGKIKKPFYELSYDAWKWHSQRKKINYWVFQGNPDLFDFETALTDNLIDCWNVVAHKEKIKKDDKVIIWITGNKSGCYALAEVTQEPKLKETSPDDHLWKKKENNNELKAGIKITHNLISAPITKEQINAIEELSDLKVGYQGTNFSATEDEYLALLELAEDRNLKKYWIYAPGENAKMWEEFYQQGIMAIDWVELGDLNNYKTKEEIAAKLQEIEGTTSSKKNDAAANYEFKEVISIGDIVIVKKGISKLLGYGVVTSDYFYDSDRNHYQKCRKVDWKLKGSWESAHSLVAKTLTDITEYTTEHPDYEFYYERLLGLMDDKNDETEPKINYTLNTIFYGPPGTGKTYTTVLRAAEIIENKSIANHSEAQKIFNENLGDRIEFITFHQNYSYEDFIQGLRPDVDNADGLAFERKDGVFKRIADRALKNLIASEKDPEKVKKQNYVIIIDEINRANISRVFGELITLIETDKRSHGAIPLKCTLPSDEEFMVPSNLFIIGTMNTADKSIALLDIALRRRFEFEAMYPLYEIDDHEIYNVEVLKKINKRIVKLKGHDFQIGHSYFMDKNIDLVERMNKKIIPLLLEYFMNDEKEVSGILEKAGLKVEKNAWPLKISELK
ncbi:AAA family ATPase [Desulfococcaceae bacterium HSG7]|nr:AAA family ATPase [Desulfococcaceae bacterium HSG7]